MKEYLIKRLLTTMPTILGITVLVFLAMRLIPGDPVDLLLADSYSEEDRRALMQEFGFDQPLPAGILPAAKPYSARDYCTMTTALIGNSVPDFFCWDLADFAVFLCAGSVTTERLCAAVAQCLGQFVAYDFACRYFGVYTRGAADPTDPRHHA